MALVYNSKKINWLRLLPLAILLIGFVAFFYFHVNNYLNFQTLKVYHDFLLRWTRQHYLLAVITYIGIYVVLTAVVVPGLIFMTLAGGFLFGLWWGTLYTEIGATLGAMLIFLAAKTALQEFLYKRAGGKLQKFKLSFQNNAWSYLLFLRLVPLFPFWLVNIAPAFLEIKTTTFFFTTLLGILPGIFVYIWLGSGIGEIFAVRRSADLNIIFQPNILLPILGLALLVTVPIIYQWIKPKSGTCRPRPW